MHLRRPDDRWVIPYQRTKDIPVHVINYLEKMHVKTFKRFMGPCKMLSGLKFSFLTNQIVLCFINIVVSGLEMNWLMIRHLYFSL